MENEQNVAPGEGLIYGLNDRPPLKDTIFAGLATSAGHFRGNHHSSAYHCRSIGT